MVKRMPVKYTEQECEFIRKHGSRLTTDELWEALESAFHSGHPKQSVRTMAKKLGVKKDGSARTRALQNRAGHSKVGDETVIGLYEYVKVAEHGSFYKAWKRKQVVVWERIHGPVPKGHCVIFLNGNRRDYSTDNLACVSNAILGKMKNGRGKSLYSEDGEVTRTALKVCELDLTLKEAANDFKR